MEPTDTVIPAAYPEFGLYEANWCHVAANALTPQEHDPIASLAARFGNAHLPTTR